MRADMQRRMANGRGEDDEEDLGFGDETGDEDELAEERSENPFDDSAADDLETGIEIGAEGADEGVDEGVEGEVDIGALDEGLSFGDAEGLAGEDEAGAGGPSDDDLTVGITAEESAPGLDDAGEEGTGDSGEEDVREEALPELDADEEGEFEEEGVEREMLFASDSSVPAWAPESEQWVVSREGVEALDVRGTALAVDGETLVFAADRKVWRLVKGAGPARCVPGWVSESDVVGLAVGRDGVWAADGERLWLLAISEADEFRPRVVMNDVLNTARDSGSVFVFRWLGDSARVYELDEEASVLAERVLGEEAKRIAERRCGFAVGAKGQCVALSGGGSLCVSRDFGKTFRVLSLKGVLALAFMGEGEGAPLFALMAHPYENKAVLVNIDGHPAPVCVGELFAPAKEARAGTGDDADDEDEVAAEDEEGEASSWTSAGLAWDEARAMFWVAGAAGLYALSPLTKSL